MQRIREHLSLELETYMQPQKLPLLPNFPRNANDKIDLVALKATWDKMSNSQVST